MRVAQRQSQSVTSTLPDLVLFARYPTPGECKTRLIPAVGAQGAADIHRRLTDRTIRVLRASGAPVTVAITGARPKDFEAWLGPKVRLVEQIEGGLSERLFAFLDQAPVIFFGADTPDLNAEHVQQAINGLSTHEVVIGPATDGGYYLIGMRAPYPGLLADIPWSTDEVLPETLSRLDALGIDPFMLEPLSDCDRPQDLMLWPDLAVKQDTLLAQTVGE